MQTNTSEVGLIMEVLGMIREQLPQFVVVDDDLAQLTQHAQRLFQLLPCGVASSVVLIEDDVSGRILQRHLPYFVPCVCLNMSCMFSVCCCYFQGDSVEIQYRYSLDYCEPLPPHTPYYCTCICKKNNLYLKSVPIYVIVHVLCLVCSFDLACFFLSSFSSLIKTCTSNDINF